MIRADQIDWTMRLHLMSTPAEPLPGLGATLDTVVSYLRRYVVITDDQAVAVALWVAHTHAIDAADCTPYLQITSATKRSGKTRLLEVLEPVVRRPWLTGRTSAAALMRKVDAERPTVLLDESDASFNGDQAYAEALRGLLNSGYRRSGKSTVCVGQGAKMEARDFSTFAPKAIAGIGDLPGTIADRAIRIELRRRTTDEPCARWRERDGGIEAGPIRISLARWATPATDVLRAARPELPAALGDRQTDVWEPLLAIADLAGDDWPQRARRAAVRLAGGVEDTDIRVELLRDLVDVVAVCDTVVLSKTILAELVKLEDRPWGSYRHEKPISGRALASLLKPLGVHPWNSGAARGYRVDAIREAIARYLPPGIVNVSEPQ
jgi:hypothetical protein